MRYWTISDTKSYQNILVILNLVSQILSWQHWFSEKHLTQINKSYSKTFNLLLFIFAWFLTITYCSQNKVIMLTRVYLELCSQSDRPVWAKSHQMSIKKLPKICQKRKMKYMNPFSKNAQHALYGVRWAINLPIWSHWLCWTQNKELDTTSSS